MSKILNFCWWSPALRKQNCKTQFEIYKYLLSIFMGSNICVGCFGRPVQFVPKILEVWREKIKRKHGKECSFVIRNGDSKGNQTQIPSWQLYIGSSIVQWAGTQESNFCVFADCVAPGFYGNTWPTQLGWIFNKHEFMLWSRNLWVHDYAKTVQS